jgi:Fic family protein
MMRAGKYVRQPSGYSAFVPAPLPPKPPVAWDEELSILLGEAERSLGRLDGVGSLLPNPELFVAMYVRQEAVLSSQIEGTQSTLDELLLFELDSDPETTPDVEEVFNYVAAMNHGLDRLRGGFPLSLRLIREMHELLLRNTRGAHRTPGAFRQDQNFIGPRGASIARATFIPPPVAEMHVALDHLEMFLHDTSLPLLIQAGLVHAQFETIHPFSDGNGRIGRLLITLLLVERGALQLPLLYLSYFLKLRRAEYFDRLMAIRNEGRWEEWLKFFLRGVLEVSKDATDDARSILALRAEDQQKIRDGVGTNPAGALALLDSLYARPYINVRSVESRLGVAYATANKIVASLVSLGILKEVTGGRRNRIFSYRAYLDLFDRTRDPQRDTEAPEQITLP